MNIKIKKKANNILLVFSIVLFCFFFVKDVNSHCYYNGKGDAFYVDSCYTGKSPYGGQWGYLDKYDTKLCWALYYPNTGYTFECIDPLKYKEQMNINQNYGYCCYKCIGESCKSLHVNDEFKQNINNYDFYKDFTCEKGKFVTSDGKCGTDLSGVTGIVCDDGTLIPPNDDTTKDKYCELSGEQEIIGNGETYYFNFLRINSGAVLRVISGDVSEDYCEDGGAGGRKGLDGAGGNGGKAGSQFHKGKSGDKGGNVCDKSHTGGDGGIAGPAGGHIKINVEKNFYLSGTIDASGLDGGNGKNGKLDGCGFWSSAKGGGGGGGAGGSGGGQIEITTNDLQIIGKIDVTGGRGGRGGEGAVDGTCDGNDDGGAGGGGTGGAGGIIILTIPETQHNNIMENVNVFFKKGSPGSGGSSCGSGKSGKSTYMSNCFEGSLNLVKKDVTPPQKCAPLNTCFPTKPKFCNLYGEIIDNCMYCRCEEGDNCDEESGSCEIQEIEEEEKTCAEQYGDICELSEYCPGNWISAQENRCCSVECEDKELCDDAVEGTRKAGCLDDPGSGYNPIENKYCEEGECYECVEGLHWSNAEQACVGEKQDWVGNRGICKEENKCYCMKDICDDDDFDEVSPSEEPSPLGWCVDPGQYKDDHYCENGAWTTRTKFLARAVLDAGKTYTNYIFHCDVIGTNNRQTCILKSSHNLIIGALLNKDETPTDSSYFNEFFEKTTGMKENYETQSEGTHFKDLYYNVNLQNNINSIVGYDESKNIVVFSNDKNTYTSVAYPSFSNKFNRIQSSLQDNNKYFFLKNYGKQVQVVNRISDLVGYYDGQNVHVTTFAERDTYWNKLKVFSNNRYCMYEDYSFKTTPITIENEFLPNEELINEGCCEANQCWNGKSCVDNGGDSGNNYDEVFDCVDGEWQVSKVTVIADQLLDFAKNKKYVLNCDNYKEVIRTTQDIDDDNLIEGGTNGKACVLKYDITNNAYKVAVGFPIKENNNINNIISSLKLSLIVNCNLNNINQNQNKFQQCENKKLWYNPVMNLFIFSKDEINLKGTIIDKIEDFFNFFISLFTGTQKSEIESSKMYLSKIDKKKIKAFKYENYFLVKYTAFNNLCSSITLSDTTCNFQNPVMEVRSDDFNNWKELTTKIRLQNE